MTYNNTESSANGKHAGPCEKSVFIPGFLVLLPAQGDSDPTPILSYEGNAARGGTELFDISEKMELSPHFCLALLDSCERNLPFGKRG